MGPFPFFGFPNFRYNYGANAYCPNDNTYNGDNNTGRPGANSYRNNLTNDINKKATDGRLYKDNLINTYNNNEATDGRPYNDDLIIIALLIFLYTEKVNDTYLFIALIMLLLS